MADKVVELRKTQDEATRRRPRPRKQSPLARAAALRAAGGDPAAGRRGGPLRVISRVRALHQDRQCLCGIAEGPDHGGYFRQDQPAVTVREGERVEAGERAVRDRCRSRRLCGGAGRGAFAASARNTHNLKSSLAAATRRVELARETVDVRQASIERKTGLLTSRSGSRADVDAATTGGLAAAQTAGRATGAAGEEIPQPVARRPRPAGGEISGLCTSLDNARSGEARPRTRDVRAPIAGTATQVASIQLGRYARAGTPMLSMMDDAAVGRRQSERDRRHHLRIGQAAAI